MEPYVIPLAALIVSVATLGLAVFSVRRYARADYVSSLERRVGSLEGTLGECEAARVLLAKENLNLLRSLANSIPREDVNAMIEHELARERGRKD